jgi:hypothetical protein
MITEQTAFAEALLAALDARGFAGGSRWVWSFHDYNDVERGEDRVTALRARLAGRWGGRRAPDGGPLLYATEGGCRLERVDGRADRQAERLRSALARLAANGGVGLFTQYTVEADPRYDCGLRDAAGRWRPAFDAWVE